MVTCPICKGEGGSYDYCGEDYSAVWLMCSECLGRGEIEETAPIQPVTASDSE